MDAAGRLRLCLLAGDRLPPQLSAQPPQPPVQHHPFLSLHLLPPRPPPPPRPDGGHTCVWPGLRRAGGNADAEKGTCRRAGPSVRETSSDAAPSRHLFC